MRSLNFYSPKIDKQFLFSASPQFSFVQALHLLEPQLTDPSLTSIHASAQIFDSAKLGRGVSIGATQLLLVALLLAAIVRFQVALLSRGHLNIVDHVIVAGMPRVTKNINKSGAPLQTNKDWHKSNARYKVLYKLGRSVATLEKNNS